MKKSRVEVMATRTENLQNGGSTDEMKQREEKRIDDDDDDDACEGLSSLALRTTTDSKVLARCEWFGRLKMQQSSVFVYSMDDQSATHHLHSQTC